MRESRPLHAQSLSDIPATQVDWLVPGRVPLGMLTILAGDPGVGKSLLTAEWVARVTSEHGESDGGVILVTSEDSPSATLRPRLQAAGARVERVWLPHDEDGDCSLWLPDDMEQLRQLAQERDAGLVVIDPLSAHLSGGVNSWQDQSVRGALAPLSRMAEALKCAVVVVIHLRKSRGGEPIHQIGGSVAFPGIARSVLFLGRDPEDADRRVLAHGKCNVAAKAPSLAYTIEVVTESLSDTEVAVPRLRLIGECGLTAEQMYSDFRHPDRLSDAKDFLAEELSDGPIRATVIENRAKDRGIAERTLKRAKKDLRVRSLRQGGLGGKGDWLWSLPEAEPSAKEANADEQSPGATGDVESLHSRPKRSGPPSPDRRGPIPNDGPLSGSLDGDAEAERLAAKWPHFPDDFAVGASE
jgi:putative DNA primase/helicase